MKILQPWFVMKLEFSVTTKGERRHAKWNQTKSFPILIHSTRLAKYKKCSYTTMRHLGCLYWQFSSRLVVFCSTRRASVEDVCLFVVHCSCMKELLLSVCVSFTDYPSLVRISAYLRQRSKRKWLHLCSFSLDLRRRSFGGKNRWQQGRGSFPKSRRRRSLLFRVIIICIGLFLFCCMSSWLWEWFCDIWSVCVISNHSWIAGLQGLGYTRGSKSSEPNVPVLEEI